MIRSLFCVASNLLLLAILAAGDADDNPCPGIRWFDASYKGNLSSHMYGKMAQYPPNLKCQERIQAPPGHKIKVTFKDLDVVPSSLCMVDNLVIWERDSTKIGTFCGNQLPRPIVSKDNQLIFTFETDYLQGGRGYLLEYESGPYIQLCNGRFQACRNRNCYDPEKACDGVDDCGDGTDEENCGHKLLVNPPDCGTPNISPRTGQETDRLVGGTEVRQNSWPWQVSLQDPQIEPSGHFCGGTLINTLWVFTATHCVEGKGNPGDIRIVLGSHGKFTKTRYQQDRYSARVISFPELLGDDIANYELVNDASLIRLNAPVILNAGVHPACLPPFARHPSPGTKCYSTGWGETRGSGSSDALKQSVQTVLTHDVCRVTNGTTQVCVGNVGESACSGDSGGPLNCKVNGKWYVMGAASYVTTTDYNNRALCAGPGAHTVYSASAFKIDWIINMIQKYSQL